MVEQLTQNLTHFATIVERDCGVAIAHMPATGAAGGISGGLVGVAQAQLVSGVETMITACGYQARLAQGDIWLLITGEGKLDEQTPSGKAPYGIAQLAHKYQIPVLGVAGAVTASTDDLKAWGFVGTFSLLPHLAPLETALANGEVWLTQLAYNLGNVLALTQR
jgi:glycerate kinase